MGSEMCIRDRWTPAPLKFSNFEKKVALCVNPDELQTDTVIEKTLRESAAKLEDKGWSVTEIPCPPLRTPAEMQLLLWMSEMRRNGTELVEKENDPDANFVFAEFQRRYPAPDLNGFLDLLQARAAFVREWMQFTDEYPVVMIPVSATLPFKDNLDVESPESLTAIVEAQMTQIGLPFMGIPAIAVSTGSVDQHPVGVQLVAGRYREDILFAAARDIEASVKPVTPLLN